MHKWFRNILIVFYVFAGCYHFINPDFYAGLIPSYLPNHKAINTISGFSEISLGLLVLFTKTRKIAGYLLILMLISFIPSHIYFIQIGSCVPNGLCVAEWVSYTRLLVVHPILMIWVAKVCFTPQKKHNIACTNS